MFSRGGSRLYQPLLEPKSDSEKQNFGIQYFIQNILQIEFLIRLKYLYHH